MIRRFAFLLLPVIFLTACESFTADRYVPSTSNQAVLKSMGSAKKFGVAPFAVENEQTISVACRMAGPIQVAGSGDHAEYIQKALVDELQTAGKYSLNASKVFKADLKQVNVKTISPASWTLSGDFYMNDQFLKSIETVYPYKTSYSAMGACNNAAENFPYAVDQFIGEFIKSGEFKSVAR